MGDRLEFLDRYERLGVHLPALRRACVLASDLTVWTLQPPIEPLASWRRLRRVHDRTGLWPFLAGSQLVERLWHDAITGHDPTAVRRGLAMDAGAWLAERAALAGAPDPASVQVDPIALARAAAAEPQVAFTSRDTVIGLIQARQSCSYHVPHRTQSRSPRWPSSYSATAPISPSRTPTPWTRWPPRSSRAEPGRSGGTDPSTPANSTAHAVPE
jgi:hypothetical protein